MPAFPIWTEQNCSLVKKHLTQKHWDTLSPLATTNGYTLEQAIRSGVEQQDSSVGIYAGDAESYTLFAPLLDPIIQDYHDHAGAHAGNNFSVENLPEVSITAQQRVRSTRIRVGRNLAGFPLGAVISAEQRLLVEDKIVTALNKLPPPLQGRYFSLITMSATENSDLVARHILFKSEDRFLHSAGLMRDWPQGRGLYLSHDEVFSAWVNEEDQLRIIALQTGGDIKGAFATLSEGIAALSAELDFLYSEKLGYLSSCPTNLGTAMRASVHMQLDSLIKDEAKLKQIADKLGLQVRGIHGEHSESQGGIYDISNRMRLGVTEAEAVGHLIRGVNALAMADK